jgi:glutathione synthase
MAYRFAFVMDPLERILPDKDTTFVFMLESLARGHAVYFTEVADLFAHGDAPHARVRRAEVMRPSEPSAPHYRLFEESVVPLTSFDAVFMRKDPPFDMTYFFATHLLGLVDPKRTLVVNDPKGLREANEKLYALHFPSVIPSSMVSSDIRRLKGFLDEMGGEMIVKPLDGAGGAGVFHIHRRDRNLNALLESATLNGTRLTMAQRYVPEVRQGDKRLIVLDGEPLGGVLRVPSEEEHRGNIHVGGQVVKSPVDDRDREICRQMAPRLRQDGLYFVGLDVIGGFVTEVNVTSPTGVQEIDRLDDTNLEAKVLDFVEQRATKLDRTRA